MWPSFVVKYRVVRSRDDLRAGGGIAVFFLLLRAVPLDGAAWRAAAAEAEEDEAAEEEKVSSEEESSEEESESSEEEESSASSEEESEPDPGEYSNSMPPAANDFLFGQLIETTPFLESMCKRDECSGGQRDCECALVAKRGGERGDDLASGGRQKAMTCILHIRDYC